MKAIIVLATLLGAYGISAAAPASAQASTSTAQGQPQTAMPRGPIRTPLGRQPAEVLASKIVVSNMQRSFDFYTKVVGLQPAKTISQTQPFPQGGADNSQWPMEYGLNFSGSYADAFFDLLRPRADNLPTPASTGLVQLVFKVPDAQAVMRRAKDLGYTVTREAPVVGAGEMSIGMLRDPDGYNVEIIQAASYPADQGSHEK